MSLDSAKQDFQEELRRRASWKKMALVRAAKQKPVVKAKAPLPSVKTSVLEKLNEILALLKIGKRTGPLKFIVTERDASGEVKSFKVEG